MLYLLIDGCFKGLSKNYRLLILFAFFLVMLNCSTVLMLTMQVEAVAIYCICCIVCVFGCISWSIDTRCAGKIWSFSLDRSCRCSAMCVCLNQVICLIFIRFFCLIDHAGKGDCCIKVFYFLKGNFYALFSGWALLFIYLSSLPSLFSPLAVNIYFRPYWCWNRRQWFWTCLTKNIWVK